MNNIPTQKSIYILEDNNDIREILEYIFTDHNYIVKGYPTIKLFRNQMDNALPNLVLLDINLPDGNGLDVCSELKNNGKTHNIPVLMMSANLSLMKTTSNCAANEFINKPFDINDVLKRVHNYLA